MGSGRPGIGHGGGTAKWNSRDSPPSGLVRAMPRGIFCPAVLVRATTPVFRAESSERFGPGARRWLAVAARVAAVLQDAWQRLADQQAAVIAAIGDNARSREAAGRLAQFQAAITDLQQCVDSEARAFVSVQLPHLYEEGARAAARAVGGHFSWTLIHREALQSLASDSYADFLRRSQEEQRMAGAFYRAVRDAARREVPLLAAGQTTALPAAKAMADRLAAEHQLTTVIYRNGLGWTAPKVRHADSADLWTWLIIAAHTQLRLARPLAEDLRRPWERPAAPRRLTPARVRRGFRNVHATTARPAAAPKPSRPGVKLAQCRGQAWLQRIHFVPGLGESIQLEQHRNHCNVVAARLGLACRALRYLAGQRLLVHPAAVRRPIDGLRGRANRTA